MQVFLRHQIVIIAYCALQNKLEPGLSVENLTIEFPQKRCINHLTKNQMSQQAYHHHHVTTAYSTHKVTRKRHKEKPHKGSQSANHSNAASAKME